MTIPTHIDLSTVAYDVANEKLICSVLNGPLDGEVFEGALPAGRLVAAEQPDETCIVLVYYRTTWNAHAVLTGNLLDSLDNSVLADLRARYRDLEARPDPANLWPDNYFTVRQLRMMYQAITGEEYQKDTFRRRMIPFLRGTGKFFTECSRPAELYEVISEEG